MPKEKLGVKLRNQYDWEEKPDDLLSKFKNKFESPSNPVMGKILGDHVFLKILPEQRHYWSPEMDITFEQKEKGTYVREVIGPNSNIYTLTMSLLFFTGVLLFFAIMFLSSQITLDLPTTTTWIFIWIGVMIVLLLLLIMYFGRRKAKPQIVLMKNFVDSVMKSYEQS
jgi:hypothetical protein